MIKLLLSWLAASALTWALIWAILPRKTEDEQRQEDEEQMEYLRKWKDDNE